MIYQIILSLMMVMVLNGCGNRETPAPVEESLYREARPKDNRHVVSEGETLFAVAFRYDMDYAALARLNHLEQPYTVQVGQVLYLSSNNQNGYVKKDNAGTGWQPLESSSHKPSQPQRRPSKSVVSQEKSVGFWSNMLPNHSNRWMKPAEGRVLHGFAPTMGQKGIDIAGRAGDNIRASAGGIVAYAGTGLPGYGNLIIIKHDNQWLTAYGHNQKNLVREGQKIKAGQIIAEMGTIERHIYGVHFEMRQLGRPVNPLNYL